HGTAAVLRDGVEVAEVGEGSYFGELAILDGAPRSATIRSKRPGEVAVLGIRMFRTLLREVPDLAEQLLVGLAGALREAQSKIPVPTPGCRAGRTGETWELLARECIRDTVARYNHSGDTGRFDTMVEC